MYLAHEAYGSTAAEQCQLLVAMQAALGAALWLTSTGVHARCKREPAFGMQDADGKTAADLTTEPEIRDMLGNLQLAEDFQKDER